MTGVAVLLTRWFLGLLCGLAAAPLVALIVIEWRRRLRRRHGIPAPRRLRRWVWRIGAVMLSVALSLAATADAVNRHFGYLPTFASLFGAVSRDYVSSPIGARTVLAAGDSVPAHGVAERIALDGPVSGVHGRDAYVYLPPQYFDPARPFRRFPVLYLLHGTPGDAADWLRSGRLDVAMDTLLTERRIRPFIVVMPDVNGGFLDDTECADVPGGPHVQTYLTVDVVHTVDTRFRTIADRAHRAIGGLSTGGYCATNLTLRHQDVFSASISHSGNLRPGHSMLAGRLFPSAGARLRNTPAAYLRTIPITQPLAMYFDTGADDGWARGPSIWAAHVLRARGVTAALHVYPRAGHTWRTWSAALYRSLPWVSAWFSGPPPLAVVARFPRRHDGLLTPRTTSGSVLPTPTPSR